MLLNKPSEGLASVVVQDIARPPLYIPRDHGITSIPAKQNVVAARNTADRAMILNTGSVVFDGAAQEVLDNEQLRAEYLSI